MTMKLWYEQPAKIWTEALPVGNGRLGAMLYGNTCRERVPLNEDTLWSGYPRDLNPRNKKEFFLQAVELSKEGKYAETQELIEKELTSGWSQSYMPLGDLIISMKHVDVASSYTRSLDLETAVAAVNYEIDGTAYKREIFASAPDNIIVIRITADKPGNISFSLDFKSLLRSRTLLKDGRLLLKGEAPSHVEPNYVANCTDPVIYSEKDEERGMLFCAAACVKASGGIIRYQKSTGPEAGCGFSNMRPAGSEASGCTSHKCTAGSGDGSIYQKLDQIISVENADAAVIMVSAHTSFNGYDKRPFLDGREYEEICMEELDRALCKSYKDLLSDHITDYKKYYDRVSLELGENEVSSLPTDKRLFRFCKKQDDPALYTLLFQYGRYLMIASSRPGTQPANLQGIWNSELRPPWSSNYTININAQMNYWPAFPCALGELQQPLVEMVRELAITGRVTAREVYGARGFTSHHNTDLWRLSSPVGNREKGNAVFAFWNMSAGWLCRHLFDQYEYTLDTKFLRNEAYPIMKAAAEFLLDIITEDKDGCLIICPSTSPENVFFYEDGTCSISATTTMTMTIARELFKNCMKSCEILDCDPGFAIALQAALTRFRPFKTGSKRQLLEWYEEYAEVELTHRHVSHLYGLYPANLITFEDSPELALACKNSLDIRGDEGTGWSLGWKINLWARLFDGDRALKLLNRQLRVVENTGFDYSSGGGTYINMLDAHPPFQIDGNFGATSGIAEMLLQSRDSKIFILPALPSAWEKGWVRGLRAKELIKVDIQWGKGFVKTELVSEVDQVIRVAIKGVGLEKVELKAGITVVIEKRIGDRAIVYKNVEKEQP